MRTRVSRSLRPSIAVAAVALRLSDVSSRRRLFGASRVLFFVRPLAFSGSASASTPPCEHAAGDAATHDDGAPFKMNKTTTCRSVFTRLEINEVALQLVQSKSYWKLGQEVMFFTSNYCKMNSSVLFTGPAVPSSSSSSSSSSVRRSNEKSASV